jgi:hypothetical protein
LKVVRPAKGDPEAQIIFDGNPMITISPESIKAMLDFVPEEGDEEIQEFKNVRLQIRATDLDSFKRGWAAIIPSLSNRRVKLQLSPTIKPDQLTAGATVYGNIDVLFIHPEDGERIPKLVFLKELVPPNKGEHIGEQDAHKIPQWTRKIIIPDRQSIFTL